MKLACAIATSAVLGMPAGAQDLIYSDMETKTCLGQRTSYLHRLDCAGKSADDCMDRSPHGSSTIAMSGCFGRELDFWDALLNNNYQRTLELAKTVDQQTQAHSLDRALQEPLLRDMQHKWIAFRDASCNYERSLWQGGTNGGPAKLLCKLEMTAEQALHLAPEQRPEGTND